MRLHLVRHPQPDIAAEICYGRTDLAVSPQEHARVVSTLTEVLPKRASLFSSPLIRCAELADILSSALGYTPIRFDARLMEMDFGNWEMRSWSDIQCSEIDAWANDMAHYRTGGGESVTQMAQRVQAFMQDLTAMHLDDVIVICHAGTIRLLLACQYGFDPAEMALHAAQTRHKIPYGDVIVLDC